MEGEQRGEGEGGREGEGHQLTNRGMTLIKAKDRKSEKENEEQHKQEVNGRGMKWMGAKK